MSKKKLNQFPKGWDEERVRGLLAHYEGQTEDQAAEEDDAAYLNQKETFVSVPVELLPTVRKLIAKKAS